MIKTNILILLLLVNTIHLTNASYLEQRFQDIDKQLFDSTCGIASVSNILKKSYSVYKNEVDLLALIEIKPEYSFVDLSLIAKEFGIPTLGVKITIQQLKTIHSPTILHINRFGSAHFVILKGIDDTWVQIDDPGWGGLNYTRAQFENYWLHEDGLGRALIFLKDEKILINSNRIYSKKILTQ